MEKEQWAERIQQLVDAKCDGNKMKFTKSIGKSSTSSIASTLIKKTVPSSETMAQILTAFPDVSAEWLLMGRGPMLKGGTEVVEAVDSKELDELREQNETLTKLLGAAREQNHDLKVINETLKEMIVGEKREKGVS